MVQLAVALSSIAIVAALAIASVYFGHAGLARQAMVMHARNGSLSPLAKMLYLLPICVIIGTTAAFLLQMLLTS